MKRFLAMVAVLVISVASVMAAMQVTLDPWEVTLPEDGSPVYVDVNVENSGIYPRALVVDYWCKELSGDEDVCDEDDEMYTDQLNVDVDSLTDGSGHATATLSWNGPEMGLYHYTICVAEYENGPCISEPTGGSAASATGDAFIPEFTAIGAGLALLGAGIFASKKRKQN